MSRSRRAMRPFVRKVGSVFLLPAVCAFYVITVAPAAHAAGSTIRTATAHPRPAKTKDADKDVVVDMSVSQASGTPGGSMSIFYSDREGPSPESPARAAGVRPATVILTEGASYSFSLTKGVKFGSGLSSFSVSTGAQMKTQGVVNMHAIKLGPKHKKSNGCSTTLTRTATLTGKFKLVSGTGFYGTTLESSFPLTLQQISSSGCPAPCPPTFELLGSNSAKHTGIFVTKSGSGKVSEFFSFSPPKTASKPGQASFYVSLVNGPASDFTAAPSLMSARVKTSGGNTSLTGSGNFAGGAPFSSTCGSKTTKTSSGSLTGNLTMHHDAVGKKPLGTATAFLQKTV